MGLDNPIHLLIVLVVVLLIFGAKRLPEMGRSLGDGMRGFKDSLSGATLHDSPSAVQASEVEVPLETAVPDTVVVEAGPPIEGDHVVPIHSPDAVATVSQPSAGQTTAA